MMSGTHIWDEEVYAAAGGTLQERVHMTGGSVESVVLVSAVTASVSFAVTETKLFRPVREWVKGRSRLLGELVSCGYCLGHWVAFALVGTYRPRLFDSWGPLDYVLTALVIAWLAGFQWVFMCWLMERAGK